MDESTVHATDFGFTSQRIERSFGLMDYNARYYNPRIGRFVSPDTIVPEPTSSGGFNRYRYTRNNPLKYTDPSGHCGIESDSGFATMQVQESCDGKSIIDDSFSEKEKELIVDTLSDYSELVGGGNLYGSGGVTAIVPSGSEGLLGYDLDAGTVLLPPHLYHATFTHQPFDIFQDGAFPNAPAEAFPDQETVFQFILAHELAHALENGHPQIRGAFQDAFYDDLYITIGPVKISKTNDLFSNSHIISRNNSRVNYEGEVLADVVAATLYSESLINSSQEVWVEEELPNFLD